MDYPVVYICQIGDSLFDVRFPTCQFYWSKCNIMGPPNFRKVLQTFEEICNKTFQTDASDLSYA